MDDAKKYNCMENVIQYINQNFVSLDETQVKFNNKVIGKLIDLLTVKMKEQNPLFEKLYTTIFYGGSYYDGLKVGNPEEYDCDVLLKLPSYSKPVVTADPNYPGFVKVFVSDFAKLQKQPEYDRYYKELPKLLEDNYLCGNKLKKWMESILDKVFNDIKKEKNHCCFEVDGKHYYFKKTKGGPAFTMHVTDSLDSNKILMDVDLVPCFEFDSAEWPRENGFRQNTTTISTFFVVPKTPKGCKEYEKAGRYWRLSFQQQEQKIIGSRQSLKPAVKLLKKLRDNEKHVNISSYFIKTVFLWQVNEQEEGFWIVNLSNLFMKMLRKYQEYLGKREIPYYWNKEFNLLQHINSKEIENIYNRITKIIKDIDNKFENDPFVVANYLVPKDKLNMEQIKQQVKVGKKFEKRHAPDVPEGKKLAFSNLATPILVNSVYANIPNGVVPQSNTLTAVESPVEEALKEINKKLDLIITEQEGLRALLEVISDRQTNLEDKLRERTSRNAFNIHDAMSELLGPNLSCFPDMRPSGL
ncbi:hypothetical protein Trydic_g15092 [Trypoxylus dichotomus]